MISPEGLEGAFNILQTCLKTLEVNYCYRMTVPCEPQLGKRGLYPTLSTKESSEKVRVMMDFLAYADGKSDLIEISKIINADILDCDKIARQLKRLGLLQNS